MKGVLIKEYIKDISEIKVSYDLPIPDTFSDGDLLIKVMAVGMGFADYLQVRSFNLYNFIFIEYI
jgi:NADPH:quinone reductase-like Zn-dependent oxidoreductase